MTKAKKSAPKAIADVAHPGKSAPSDTSKPIITHRPIMKDPMVVEETADRAEKEAEKTLSKRTSETKIIPPSESATNDTADSGGPAGETPQAAVSPSDIPAAENPEEPAKAAEETEDTEVGQEETSPEADPESKPEKPETTKTDTTAGTNKDKKPKKPDDSAITAKQAEEDAKLQKLIDNKKYFLPINAVEQRRNARVAMIGVILVLVLAIAWVDVALDAGLIQLGNVKPVTHFFSN